MDLASERPTIIEFGRFRVLPHRRELLADGRPIYLGGRTFDVLMALIEGQGVVVKKDALMQRVWPNWIVEESSLHVQISALRNAFGGAGRAVPGAKPEGAEKGGFRSIANTRANGEVPPIRPFAWIQSGGSVDPSKACLLREWNIAVVGWSERRSASDYRITDIDSRAGLAF
jgi:hypothetical protein